MGEIVGSDCEVIDLFCGVGGLSHGFVLENFKIAAGYDFDDSCQFAFEQNNNSTFYKQDVAVLTGDDLIEKFSENKIKVLVGCAPCQPFSSYSFKNNHEEETNDKWTLLYHFLRLIKEVGPEIVSMENVSQLINFKKAPVFNDFINGLKELGYFVHYEIVYCPDYGIPQTRKRLVLLASKLGQIKLIPKTHTKSNYVTVRDTISSLAAIEDGETCADDILHRSRKLNSLNKQRIKITPAGGTWKSWPVEMQLKCHQKTSGKTFPSVYGRMKWDEPAPTVTTHCIGYGNGRFGHPDQDRAISLREAALFQTFPVTYKFYDESKPMSTVSIARQLGNAVPVMLGSVIAKSIKDHINQLSSEN